MLQTVTMTTALSTFKLVHLIINVMVNIHYNYIFNVTVVTECKEKNIMNQTFSGSSKTPPCVLRKNAKMAEKNLKDIVELTEREKIYTPSVVSNFNTSEFHQHFFFVLNL